MNAGVATDRSIGERLRRSAFALPLAISLAAHAGIGVAWWGGFPLSGLGLSRAEGGTSVGAPKAWSAVVMLEPQAPMPPRPPVVRATESKPDRTSLDSDARVAKPATDPTDPNATTGNTPATQRHAEVARGAFPAAPPSTNASDAGPSLTFAGLSADAARASSVVYVVDASAPMVSTLPWVLGEVERSVGGLLPTQRFNVVLFGERSAGDAGARLFAPGLVDATSRQRTKLADYLRSAEASGRSTPIAGLREAMKLKPRVVFVLARAIARTQGATWDRGNDAIMSELETLNPIDPATGRRATVIKVIQFLDADPTGLLPRIAEVHGEPGGPPAAGSVAAKAERANLRTVTRSEVAGGGSEAPAGDRLNLGVR
jgi:hypothetical protein